MLRSSMTSIGFKKQGILVLVFLFFSICPFLFPLPFMKTNLQPYATAFGLIIIVINASRAINVINASGFFKVLLLTSMVSCFVFMLGDINIQAVRGLFNHISVLVIPLAVYVILSKKHGISEKTVKILILFWFVVASIQLFVYRGFFANFIGTPKWSFELRGVIGLASEPSFLGIASFYMLFLAQKFKKHKVLYISLITIMGTIYAQSFMGMVFVAVYFFLYWLDNANSKKGFLIIAMLIFGLILGWYLLSIYGTSTRLYILIDSISSVGLEATVSGDESATSRYNSLSDAYTDAFSNYLIPQGYQQRVGSGYGGFIIETGVFGLIECILVSIGMAMSYTRSITRYVSFGLITFLLFMNTQVGNPLLLLIIGLNIWENKKLHVKNYGIYTVYPY